MEIADKNAYWIAHQPMRSLSDADRAKLQRRAVTPSVPISSSLDFELRSIFERKLKSSAFFKPVTEVTPQNVPEEALPESSASPVPEEEETVQMTEEMKQSSTLLTRTMLFAERRRKEGREVFRRRMVSFPFALVCLLQKLLSHDT
jgi:hypothetical protein